MLKNFIVGTAWLCFASLALRADIPYRELQALTDMSAFPFEELSQTNSPWLLVRIQPAADSGVTSGVYINAKTGELVREPGKDIEVTIKGTVSEMARFDGSAPSPDQWTYSWRAPIGSRTRDVRRFLYSPFESGGIILSKFCGAASQEETFCPYYVSPDGWDSNTYFSYLDAQRAEGRRWMKIENKEDRRRVTRQLASENPIVALQAFRVLRATPRLADEAKDYVPPTPSDLLETAALSNRALLTTDFLRQAQPGTAMSGELERLATAATNLDQLRPLAIAARSVLDFGGRYDDHELRAVCREILDQCAKVAKELPGDSKLKDEFQKLSSP